jgi:hypothetical protein
MLNHKPLEPFVSFGQRDQTMEMSPVVGEQLTHCVTIAFSNGTVVALGKLSVCAIDSIPIVEGVHFLLCLRCFGLGTGFLRRIASKCVDAKRKGQHSYQTKHGVLLSLGKS